MTSLAKSQTALSSANFISNLRPINLHDGPRKKICVLRLYGPRLCCYFRISFRRSSSLSNFPSKQFLSRKNIHGVIARVSLRRGFFSQSLYRRETLVKVEGKILLFQLGIELQLRAQKNRRILVYHINDNAQFRHL